MPRGKPPFQKPTDYELRRDYGVERSGERRAPRKGEKYLGHQGDIQEASEDMKPETSNDLFEILRPTGG
jgi:hypothetical protein